jgi:circadian clock protein KaiC
VVKYRGSDFRPGRHTARIGDSGVEIFPRLVPEDYRRAFEQDKMASGIPELDQMLSGGLERGTITLLTGPSGVGKSTLGVQFMKEAASHGERCVVYIFEEWSDTLLRRCSSVNIPMQEMLQRGALSLVQVEPLRFTADQFARMVRREVEDNKARIVMIDSISGYRLSLRGEDLVLHLHALAKYLQNMGVTVLLINEVEAITGDFRITEIGVSYMVDNIIFLRYLEVNGEIRKALGVLKKRLTDFEKRMREVEITAQGFKVGEALSDLRGILIGRPERILARQKNS